MSVKVRHDVDPPFLPRSLVCDGQIIPHKPRLVVSHSTSPPLSPSPHANSIVIGSAVINNNPSFYRAPERGEKGRRRVATWTGAARVPRVPVRKQWPCTFSASLPVFCDRARRPENERERGTCELVRQSDLGSDGKRWILEELVQEHSEDQTDRK